MNNQGMIHIAERQALKDIATYQSQLVDMSFINKKFVVTATAMCSADKFAQNLIRSRNLWI